MYLFLDLIENYIVKHSEEEPLILKNLSLETHQKMSDFRMLSGCFQGRFLSIISKIKRPKCILDIGTYTGYSALCMSEGIDSDGDIHTIDVNETLYDFQRKYFDLSVYKNQIYQHLGNALDIIPTLDKKFDLVFIDADKKNYSNYFDLVIDKMNSGGIILSDNVLWKGKIVEKNPDKLTKIIDDYNKKLAKDNRIETLLLPIRDGLSLTRVK